MREELGSLIGVGGRPAFFWHEEPAELGEFIPLSAALDFVVAHDAYPFAGWGESDGIARFQANHAEAEAASLVMRVVGVGVMVLCGVSVNVGRRGAWWVVGKRDGLVVLVECNDAVFKKVGYIFELLQRRFGWYIEEFPVLTDAELGKAVDEFVELLLCNFVLHCAQGGVDLEWKRDGGVVEFLGAYVDGAGAFPDLDPILTETGVCQDIDVSGFFVWLFLFSGHMFFRNWAVAGMRNRYARMFISANIRLFTDSLRNRWSNIGTCEDVIHAGPAP